MRERRAVEWSNADIEERRLRIHDSAQNLR